MPHDRLNWHIGTMGFSYKDWEEVFYPAKLTSKDYLTYYSRIFNAVEIDSSFYGTPKVTSMAQWMAKTPPDFTFCLKVPKVITHDAGLVNAGGLMDEFLTAVRTLGEKLGVLLFQFPPSFGVDRFTILSTFLATLPDDLRFAVEVRQRTWYTAENETADMLRRHGVAWASTQYAGLPARLHVSAPFLYIRWIGKHGAFEHHRMEQIERGEDLRRWWAALQEPVARVDDVFGFFNNDYAGFGPATANRFKEIAGLPRAILQGGVQGRLF